MAVSRPVVYTTLAAIVVAAVVLTDDPPKSTPLSTTRKPVAKRSSGPDWELPAPDPNLRFDPIRGTPRNVFVPLVGIDRPLGTIREIKAPEDLVQVPAGLAGGEGSWAYTGMVEANGVRMALLENKGNKQSGYVREGDTWKAAHVVGITAVCIVLADDKGKSQTVFRFDPNAPPKPKPEPEGGFRPLGEGTPLMGPIGPINPGPPPFTRTLAQ